MNNQLELFGGDSGEVFVKRSKKQVFEDYDAFVAKFNNKAPKTTDDCYTPQPVYDAVLQWLRTQVDIEGRSIIRPFYPGGDYKNEVYPENCVVVDNPPFSILAEIVRFYIAAKIDFFLFAPGLTLFSSSSSLCTAIVADAQIRYANGAVVCTGFLSSLFGDARVVVSTTLNSAINSAIGKGQKTGRVEINYPDNVVSSALLNAAVGGGILPLQRKTVATYAPWMLSEFAGRRYLEMDTCYQPEWPAYSQRQRQRQRREVVPQMCGNFHREKLR